MPTIRTSRAADNDLDEAFDYLSPRNPDAARRFYISARATFAHLADWPHTGAARPVSNPRLAGLRMTTIKGFQNYLVLYLPIEGGVEIARVIHGSRDVESLLQEPID